METSWISILGKFEKEESDIIFRGDIYHYKDNNGQEQEGSASGQYLSNQSFNDGTIECKVKFSEVHDGTSFGIIFFYDSQTKAFLSAGFGDLYMFSIRGFDSKWHYYAESGDKKNLVASKEYRVKVKVLGSKVTLFMNDVEVARCNLPFTVSESQVGIFCLSKSDITISDYKVRSDPPKAFIVMQFSEPYNELYDEVIKPVCKEKGIEPVRADETYSPGLIIADIIQKIDSSKIIIADISPVNANVYYEVGYAHALNKPTILIADKKTELPFDVSPFRTLFYENTIRGKSTVEEGLRNYLDTILEGSYRPNNSLERTANSRSRST